MTRSDFTKCCMGLCSFAGLTTIAAPDAEAQTANADEVNQLKGKLGAAQHRFSKLINILAENVDEPTRKKILNRLGHECAKDSRAMIEKYRNNVRGFLEEAQKQWMEKAEYDEKAGTIRIVDRSRSCTCPLVNLSETPGQFCDCTLGWQEAAYSELLGRPVKATLEQSVLRGGSACVFRIQTI